MQQKMHSCNYCNTKFTRKDNMVRHVDYFHNQMMQQNGLGNQQGSGMGNWHGGEISDLTRRDLSKYLEVNPKILKFQHHFTMIVSRPTGSGKTVFIEQMFDNI